MDITDIFNSKLLEFVGELSSINPKLKEYEDMIQLAISLNKTLPIIVFSNGASKYEEHVMTKNEDFLLCQKFDEVDKLDMVEKLKGIWRTLTPNNKEVVWKYMQLLMILQKKNKKKQ